MNHLQKRIDSFYNYIENNKIRNKEIVSRVGFTKGAVSNIITKKVDPSENFLNTFEKEFEVDLSSYEMTQSTSVVENKSHNGVPYFENIDGTATITTSFSDYPESPAFYIDYEHFNDCDAYIQVVGDSMYPAYSSGEIIAVKRIMNFDVIQWGEVYFVVTNGNANDMKTVKQLHYHEDLDKIILRSSNPNFKGDTVVKKNDILYLYIVKGKIRRNQL